MVNINDPVIRFIDDLLQKQESITDHFLSEVEKYETKIYEDPSNTLKESLSCLEDGDDWWTDIAWREIKQRRDNPDDALIGLLVRQHIERHIKRMARIQVEEDLFNESTVY